MSSEFVSVIVKNKPYSTHFRLNLDEPFAKFFEDYANSHTNKRSFMYNNRIIYADDTPRKLMMKDNDFIFVYHTTSLPIVWADKNGDTKFRIEYDEPLRKLMESRCTEPLSKYRLKYDSREVFETDTPRSLRMQPGDWIYVLHREKDSFHKDKFPWYFWIHDMNGTKIQVSRQSCFKVADVMEMYTARTGIPVSQCRFLYNFRDLNPEDKQSCVRIATNIDASSTILTMSQSASNGSSNNLSVSPDHVSLIIDDRQDQYNAHVHLKLDEPFAKFFKDFANTRIDERHHFTYNNRVIFADDTPRKLMMKDNDVIRVTCYDMSLPIVWADKHGDTRLDVKYDEPLRKLMKSRYAEPLSQYRLKYNSREVSDADTPRSLRMQPDDWIYVLAPEGYNFHAFDSNPSFWIHDMNGTKIEIDRGYISTVAEVMERYTVKTGIPASQCRFLYNFRDLNSDVKLADLKMKRGDVIGVIYKDVDGPGCPVEEDVTFSVADETGNKHQFNMKSTTTVRDVLKAYATKRGVCIAEYNLDLKGYFNKSDTLKKLGVKNDDVLNAVRELRVCELCHDKTDDPYVPIWILSQDGRRTCYRLKYDTPVVTIIRLHVSRKFKPGTLTTRDYRVVYRNRRIEDHDLTVTPRTLKLKNHEYFEFFLTMRGG